MNRSAIMTALAALGLFMLSSCAASRHDDVAVSVEPYPYSYTLELSSRLPDTVIPTRAPIDAHRRYRVNGMLESALSALLQSRSMTTATRQVTVSVEVLRLAFDYEEIGEAVPPAPPLLASSALDVPLLSAKEMDGGGMDIPYETVKTATIGFRVVLRAAGTDPVARDFSETYVQSVMHDDMRARWPDDYHSFDRVIVGIVAQVTRVVDGLLAAHFSR